MKKGFTIIELIITIIILGIIVSLAIPLYKGYTKDAQLSKYLSYVKELESASERYYMSMGDWPRQGDEPYTSEQLETYTNKIKDITGEEVTLDTTGRYYKINYGSISKYTKTPENKENYILQNPIGRIYYLEQLTEEGRNTLGNKTIIEDKIIHVENIEISKNELEIYVGGTETLDVEVLPVVATNKSVDWTSSNPEIVTVDSDGMVKAISAGTVIITATTRDGNKTATCEVTVIIPFTSQIFSYTGNIQTFTVPVTGKYRLEVWGAQGGNGSNGTNSLGGSGGYAKGEVRLLEGQNIYVYVGGSGKHAVSGYDRAIGGWNGGATTEANGGGGGGASDIRIDGKTYASRIIVAGGGGGGGYIGKGGAGGGLTGGTGEKGHSTWSGGNGGTQTSGGNNNTPGKFGYAETSPKGGAGGGGWYGGASGYTGAGGGGSGYVGGVTNGTMSSGIRPGNGQARITYIGN